MANSTYQWGGKQAFKLSGTDLHEDTLRIESTERKSEKTLRLVLPTLCITYADLKFQNAVGGMQENYPHSQAYGAVHFDPPVEILGREEIERLTYIRGASRVEIGPRRTAIEWPGWSDLVVPRLRIDRKETVDARLEVPKTPVPVQEPLRIDVKQYADGRHIGGVRLEKRHPKWTPPVVLRAYDLWVRVIEGESLKPLPEVPVNIWHWDPKARTPYGRGGFRLSERLYTGGDGGIHSPTRPSNDLEALTIDLPGRRAVARCFRPMPGQRVRTHMRAWPLTPDAMRFVWRKGDSLADTSRLTGVPVGDILARNGLKSPSDLKAGMDILLPCWAGTYRLESWDSFDRVAADFGYKDARGLARANGLRRPRDLSTGVDLKLPDWRFFYARERDTLKAIDRMFSLPAGSARTVGRVYHPDPRIPFGAETVAVPTPRFASRVSRSRR